MADSSKTEKATPKKRRDERKKGNVFLSQDAVAVATLLGSFAAFWLLSGTIAEQLSGFMRFCLTKCDVSSAVTLGDTVHELVMQGLWVLVRSVLPITLVTMTCAIVATFAQTRLLVTGESLKPKFSRVNPLQGFKRLFSLRSVVEAVKSLLKIIILLYLIYNYFTSVVTGFARFLDMELSQACSILYNDIFTLMLQVCVAFIILAAADYLYQWWDYERQLRMSKQEIKEEYKQTEGDPQVKGKIKEIQRRRAQQRMMQQVPGADVVIRNPTHVAVALRYKPDKDQAPVVVAKGLDELALRIVKVAEENQVAVVENVPLARSLFAETDLDREIPPQFYGPVAEVLVYVLKLDQEPPSNP